MANVYLSIGSNVQRTKNITAGIQALTVQFPKIQCSPIYESVSIGFDGDNFYNLVVHFETHLSIEQLTKQLTAIEDNNGRDRHGPKFSSRTLDLDLLLYDDLVLNSEKITLPRPEIYQNAFVLQPLADIARDLIDPKTQQSYFELWSAYDKSKQKLWQVTLS